MTTAIRFCVGLMAFFVAAGCVHHSAAAPPVAISSEGDGDSIIGPPYTDCQELKVKADVPKGTVKDFTMDSSDSKIYPGLKGHYKRKVIVYIPSQYVPGTAAPFIVTHDAMGGGELPKILDNMINDKRVPAMIAIMIVSGGGDGKGSERGLEYDTMSGKYAEFVETEVLPRVEKDYSVMLTKDPDGRCTMGGSSGGACALSMAWYHPDLYHRVISYSGTFVNQQSPVNPETPHGAWEYHEHIIPASDPKPLRIWMEVGENDIGAKADEKDMHNWPKANEHMAAALKAKGYHYQYVFAKGAGHVDGRVVRQTLAQALEWTWRGYTPSK